MLNKAFERPHQSLLIEHVRINGSWSRTPVSTTFDFRAGVILIRRLKVNPVAAQFPFVMSDQPPALADLPVIVGLDPAVFEERPNAFNVLF